MDEMVWYVVCWKMLGTQEAELYVDALIIGWYHVKRGRVIGDAPKWREDVMTEDVGSYDCSFVEFWFGFHVHWDFKHTLSETETT